MSTLSPTAKGSDIHGECYSRTYAENLDEQDSLKHLRHEFIIPTKDDLKSRTLANSSKFQRRSSSYPVAPCPLSGALNQFGGLQETFTNENILRFIRFCKVLIAF